jgi:hypothetical protein
MRNSGPKLKTMVVPNREARRANANLGAAVGRGARFRRWRASDPHWVRSNAIERQAVRDWLEAEERYNRNVLAWLNAEITCKFFRCDQDSMTRPM